MTAASPLIADQPASYNPILRLPRLDTLPVSYVFRFDEGQEVRLAEWCGGTVAVEGTAQVVHTGGVPSTTARVGDYVVETYGNEGPPWFVVIDAERYSQIWWPKGFVPDWEWRCYQPWDSPEPDPNPPTTPNLTADDFPFPHNPVVTLPWIDETTEVEAFQLRTTLRNQLAEWCGGEVAFDADDQLLVRLPDGTAARISDYVVLDDGVFTVVPNDVFTHRYWPVGIKPDWSHHCYLNGGSP